MMLTDIQLPGRHDGCALAEKARATHPGLPVIFMSGRGRQAAGANPLDTYVSKPYSPIALCAKVRRILDGV